MVELERPSSGELAAFDRGQRYRVLQANTATHREQLQHWIAAEGLCAEVIGVSDPTAFNILFVRCTPEAARSLEHAPGVIAISACQCQARGLPCHLTYV